MLSPHSRRRRVQRAVLVCAFPLLSLGCSKDEDGDESSQAGLGGACARYEAEELDNCLSDDDCHCGTHCYLGKCESSCAAPEECAAGEICDEFGRCRAENESALVPTPAVSVPSSQVQASSRIITIEPDRDGNSIQLTKAPGKPGKARVVAQRGVEVHCPDDEWRTACIFDLEEETAVEEVELRVIEPTSDEGQEAVPQKASLSIFDEGGGSEFVTVNIASQPPEIEPFSDGVSGAYTGLARLLEVRFAGGSSASPAGPLLLPLNVNAWGDEESLTIEVENVLGAFGSGKLVGEFALSPSEGIQPKLSGSASFNTLSFIEGRALGDEFTLLSQVQDAELTLSDEPDFLAVVMTQRIQGNAGAPLEFVWQLNTIRKGEARGDAPSKPEDVELPSSQGALADVRSSWELAVSALAQEAPNGFSLWPTDLVAWELTRRHTWAECFERSAFQVAALGATELGLPPHPGLGLIDETDIGTGQDETWLIDREMPLITAIAEALGGTPTAGELVVIPYFLDISQMPSDERDLPCRGTITGELLQGLTPRGTLNHDYDSCAVLSERTGCAMVETTDQPPISGRLTTNVLFDFNASGTAGLASLEVPSASISVEAVCQLPDSLPGCALAHASMGTTPDASFGGPVYWPSLGTTPGPISGDLSTLELAPQPIALPLDQLTDAQTATRDALLQDCDADAELLGEQAPTFSGSSITDTLLGGGDPENALFNRPGCLDPGRFLMVVDAGLSVGAKSGKPAAARTDTALALHRLNRWLQIHQFKAQSALTRLSSGAFIDGGDAEVGETDEALEDALSGWDLLLHPRFFKYLSRLEGETLLDPDYRTQFGVSTGGGDLQARAFSSVALNTVAQQSRLLQRFVEDALFDSEPEVLKDVPQFLPRLLTGAGIAWALHAQAEQAASGSLSWEEQFQAEEVGALGELAEAFSAMRRLREGANPLGIDEVDLPLYFVAEGAESGGGSGPGGRYAAVSDFLLGVGPDSTAWAPSLVRQAANYLDRARSAYEEEQDRGYRQEVDAAAHERWVGGVRDSYNQSLDNYCGPSGQSYIDDPDFRAVDCAVNRSDDICLVKPREHYLEWTESDYLGRFWQGLILGDARGTFGFESQEALDFATACTGIGEAGNNGFRRARGLDFPPGDPTSRWDYVRPESCGEESLCLKCLGDSSLNLELESGALRLDPALHVDNIQGATDATLLAFPQMRARPPRATFPTEKPECVSGSIGQGFLDLVTAALAVDSAAAAHGEYVEAYDIAITSCDIYEEGVEALRNLRENNRKTLNHLYDSKAVADTVARVAQGVKECADTAAGASKDSPWGAAVGGVAAGVACGAGAVESASDIASIQLANEIQKAQDSHERAVEFQKEETQLKICRNDAKQHLVGSERAAIDIQQALFDLRSAQGNLSGLVASAQRLWFQGSSRLRELDQSRVRPPGGESWQAEDIEQFARYQRLAQRATYLAVRAVEYEQQTSLPLREAVLDAATPAELDAVLQELWTSAATRTVAGSRPSDLHTVLSLKSDILQLGDEPNAEGFGSLSATERFRVALSSDRHAVYDESGRWIGQQIPFELVPRGAFGFDVGAVPIYAETDCAERIWSVSASIVGEDIMNGSDVSNVRIDLLKRNTFFSQWCGAPAQAEPFQIASTRPSRNLFRDPQLGEEVGGNLGLSPSPHISTRARMLAYLGVGRAELESSAYRSGATGELAARGLFGEYSLFLPSAFIAREAESGEYSTGLVLDRIDDILLRIDYVSAAR